MVMAVPPARQLSRHVLTEMTGSVAGHGAVDAPASGEVDTLPLTVAQPFGRGWDICRGRDTASHRR